MVDSASPMSINHQFYEERAHQFYEERASWRRFGVDSALILTSSEPNHPRFAFDFGLIRTHSARSSVPVELRCPIDSMFSVELTKSLLILAFNGQGQSLAMEAGDGRLR